MIYFSFFVRPTAFHPQRDVEFGWESFCDDKEPCPNGKLNLLNEQYQQKQREYRVLKAETIKVIKELAASMPSS